MKNIYNDEWTETEKLYMTMGGNSNAGVHY